MKKYVVLMVAIFMAFSAQSFAAKKKEVKSVTFKTSIDCDHCKQTIMKNIPYEKGVKDVKVDIPSKEVTIKYVAAKNNNENLKKAIEKLGYTAQVKGKDCDSEAKGECQGHDHDHSGHSH